jgi:TRAP-type mannitol/chloroaromatic compound transport system permease small subunit
MQHIVGAIDRVNAAVARLARWLALPLVAALFLQWPLRDLVKAWSREANDLGQIFFALYVAVAVTAATRAGSHLATDAVAHRFGPRMRRLLRRLLSLLALLPWALFLLVTGWPALRSSLGQLEAFPDTSNPGYFLIRTAGFLLALLVFAQGIADLLRQPAETDAP